MVMPVDAGMHSRFVVNVNVQVPLSNEIPVTTSRHSKLPDNDTDENDTDTDDNDDDALDADAETDDAD